MKIAVAGVGYVGLSLAVLLSRKNDVVAVTTTERKAEMINGGLSPIRDHEIEDSLSSKELRLTVTTDAKMAYEGARFVIVAVPTNYDPELNYFDTSTVDSVISEVLRMNSEAYIVIKSTVPIGYTDTVNEKYNTDRVFFSPEFLREGRALYDNLHPSRIVVGTNSDSEELANAAKAFAELLIEASDEKVVPTVFMRSTEAEAVKLFANTYLAMRVSFFNELDTYCELKGLNTGQIIRGVCLDGRIGEHYNNPSFGYGGYCLPKDTKQLLSNFNGVPENIITAIVKSNDTRIRHVADRVLCIARKNCRENATPVVGVFRITMKSGSDNFRQSSVLKVMECIRDSGVDILIYEPTLESDTFDGFEVVRDIDKFIGKCDAVIANRYSNTLDAIKDKVYSRDVFNRD